MLPTASPPRRPLALDREQRRRLAAYLPTLDAIADLGPSVARASDTELERWLWDLRRRAIGGDALDSLVVETFALVREAARRALGERPYDVQMLAGLALFDGKLVELATGEGKTLAAVAPVVLHALAGRGVHVLTFNDYLARRDAKWMGPVYERLGLSVGTVTEGMTGEERRGAYARDVTYLTVKEAGFDLLRDGLCLEPGELVQRPFHAALVDEADSLLIDEARVPLVIAGQLDENPNRLVELTGIARRLESGLDFEVDEAARTLFLTENGIERAEAALGCDNLFDPVHAGLHAELRNALYAQALLERDVDYIVRDGMVEMVDERTGRVAENRLWPDGLQAAVEAKEGLRQHGEGRILGSITIQHLLRSYPRICGMTATARPSAHELLDAYGLEVVTVPTHRPNRRRDAPDRIFARRGAKDKAIRAEIARVHATGRPILVGTASVAESERLAADLREHGIPCRVLNARNDAEEAEIVAEAGELGAVTISTNMAGRGTDIRLGGSAQIHRQEVLDRGGLYVLGTQRHESRRIDDQLRGRAGRQGDPGSSRFIVSLDDELLRRSGIDALVPESLLPEDSEQPIDSMVIRYEIDRAQRIAEGQGGDIRRRLLEVSERLEQQRIELQRWRRSVLEGREHSLLAERCAERWQELLEVCDETSLHEVERRLTLLAIDRAWSDHLASMQQLRDEIHLVAYAGQDPLTELYRAAATAFAGLGDTVDETVAETFEKLEIGAAGIDWQAAGLCRPSSTWTYTLRDEPWGSDLMATLANRASFGFLAALACGPILFGWALYQHTRRWLARRRGDG